MMHYSNENIDYDTAMEHSTDLEGLHHPSASQAERVRRYVEQLSLPPYRIDTSVEPRRIRQTLLFSAYHPSFATLCTSTLYTLGGNRPNLKPITRNRFHRRYLRRTFSYNLIRSCSQTYAETSILPYTLNTFVFQDMVGVEDPRSYMTSDQLHAIKALDIIDTYGLVREVHFERLGHPKGLERIEIWYKEGIRLDKTVETLRKVFPSVVVSSRNSRHCSERLNGKGATD